MYRELGMTDVKEVLRRWQARQGLREIARETRTDRKTVRRYVAAAEQCGLERDGALDDARVHEVARRVQERPATESSEERQKLEVHRDRIAAWLAGDDPLRLSKVHV